MRKVELLAPAGSMEALIAAVQNGADAVYLGGSQFGARASAVNFDENQMREAVELAHLYGVKVYVTVNTLIRDDEMETCLEYIDTLYAMGVDALIIQDLGLMNKVRHRLPDFELHASTQMHIHNKEGLEMLKRWGIKRGVLARETPLEMIRELAKEQIDLEVFVYGAYCVSYSGQCLMSSSIGHRSGNRGECAQSCRLPYRLLSEENKEWNVIDTEGKYLLSPKDLNTLSIVPELIEAGIYSFKIEGRMKRSEYVGFVTAMYRQAIDAYYANEAFEVTAKRLEAMQKLFNRGFTLGHLKHRLGSSLMSTIRPNHVGIEIGKIIKVTKDRIIVKLHHELNQGDGIRILCEGEDVGYIVNYLYKDQLLINHADAGNVIELKRMGNEKVNAPVLKTSDVVQLKEIEKQSTSNLRKVGLCGKITLHCDQPVQLTVWDENGFISEVCSEKFVEKALKTPLDEERISAQLAKTGNTPFVFKQLEIEVEAGVTFPISALNELRRKVLEVHEQKRRAGQRTLPTPLPMPSVHAPVHELRLVVVCADEEQVKTALDCGVKQLLVNERSLYQKLKPTYPMINLLAPRVVKRSIDQVGDMVHEVGGLIMKPKYVSGGLNCFNAQSAAFLFEQGVETIELSLECGLPQIEELIKTYHRVHEGGNFGVLLYGAYENMVMEACPVNMALLDNDKKNCRLCKGSRHYYLEDQKGERYPLRGDDQCIMHLYHSEKRDWLAYMEDLREMGVNTFFVNFTFETAREVCKVLTNIKEGL